jgi:hypothetical protein
MTETHHSIETDRIVMRPIGVYGTHKTCGLNSVPLFALFSPPLRLHIGKVQPRSLRDLKDVLSFRIERLAEVEQSWSMKIRQAVGPSTDFIIVSV